MLTAFCLITMSGTLVLFAVFGLCAVLLGSVPLSSVWIGLVAVGTLSLCLTALLRVASLLPFKPAADRISDAKRLTLCESSEYEQRR